MATQQDNRRLIPVQGHKGIYSKGSRFVVIWRGQKTFYGTKTEAIRAKASLIAEDRQPVERMLFRDYAARWIDSYVGRKGQPISEKTRSQYRDAIERKAVPFFNSKRLGDIRPSDIRAFIDHLGRDLEPASVRRYLAPVRAMLATAREQDLIPTNPASDVRVNVQSKRPHDEDLAKFLTPDEYRRLLAEMPEQWQPVVRFVALTGTRIEEALSARWGDLERDRDGQAVLRIRKSKTKAGRRTIPLFSDLARELTVRRLASAYSTDEDLIWTNRFGRQLDSNNLRYQVLKPAARRAAIPAIAEPRRGFHVLRHTAGSILLEKGWTIAQVSAFLGHADVAITARIYLHAVSMGDVSVLGNALSA